jgi:hypothetical protein
MEYLNICNCDFYVNWMLKMDGRRGNIVNE